jgi:hypothetical protein
MRLPVDPTVRNEQGARRAFRTLSYFLLFAVTVVPRVSAQAVGLPLAVRFTTTTSAKVFHNPTSPSSAIRNEFVTAEGLYGVAAELQVPFTSELAFTFAVEYLQHVEEGDRPIALGGSLRTLPVRDGFVVIPVEIGGAAFIPISDETFRLTMGAGVGATFLHRIQEIAGVGVTTQGTPVGYGIHVSVEFDVLILPGIYGHFASRFRDPEVTVTTRYAKATVVHNGTTLVLPSEPMHTRVNVDGLSLSAGIAVDLHRLF